MTPGSHQPLTREQMAWRAAQDLLEGDYVNLGIGIPTLAASFVPAGREVIFHSENGILGMGPKPEPGKEDPYMVDAGKNLTTLVAGGCFVHHADAFLMIRGGHLDVSLLGAFEVSEKGDLANWTTEDPAFPPGVGGAMDLAVGARAIRVIMDHTDKRGEPRILKACTYPLTAASCVKRIYTNLAVIDVTPQGLSVIEMIPRMTLATAGADRAEAAAGRGLAAVGAARGAEGPCRVGKGKERSPLRMRHPSQIYRPLSILL
jgi:3-oxoadipate CoA-transferase beta subunit